MGYSLYSNATSIRITNSGSRGHPHKALYQPHGGHEIQGYSANPNREKREVMRNNEEKARSPSTLQQYLKDTIESIEEENNDILREMTESPLSDLTQAQIAAFHDRLTLNQGKQIVLREVSQICYDRGEY